MGLLDPGKRTPKITGRISVSASRGNRITKNLPTVAQRAVRRLPSSPRLNPAQNGQDFRSMDVANRSVSDPREDIALKATYCFIAMACGPGGRILGKPFARDNLEAIGGLLVASQLLRLAMLPPGSTPLARSLRAASLLSRASFSPTSGYTPRASRFSLPSKRYFSRHHLLPVGETSRYSPRSSESLQVFPVCLIFLTTTSVRGILGASLVPKGAYAPIIVPTCPRLSMDAPSRTRAINNKKVSFYADFRSS